MIDLIVSLALMALAVSSAGALSTTSARTNVESGQRSQATGLADRELEALRQYRDSEESASHTWASMWAGLTPDGNGCYDFFMQQAAPVVEPDGTTGYEWKPVNVGSSTPVGFTSANASDIASVATDYNNYSRLVTACPTHEVVYPIASQTVQLNNILQISVKVTWTGTSGTTTPSEVDLQSDLTDWQR